MSTHNTNNEIPSKTTSELLRDFIEKYEKKFSHKFGNKFLQYQKGKVFEEADIYLKSIENKIDSKIHSTAKKQFVVKMSKHLVGQLKPLYDELMDLGDQENILLKSLIAIGAVVRHKLMTQNDSLREDLINTMKGNKNRTDISMEEYEKFKEIANEVLTVLQNGFRTDLHEIYNEIKT